VNAGPVYDRTTAICLTFAPEVPKPPALESRGSR
jgi:hypothetical protein